MAGVEPFADDAVSAAFCCCVTPDASIIRQATNASMVFISDSPRLASSKYTDAGQSGQLLSSAGGFYPAQAHAHQIHVVQGGNNREREGCAQKEAARHADPV